MSERLENEATSSVIVSALGAWLGLGGGLALLSLALLAVLNAVFHEDLSRDPQNILKSKLALDLASARYSSLNISEDGSSLQLLRTRPGRSELFTVLYVCKNDKLTRHSSENETLEFIGYCPEFKFARDGDLITANFQAGNTSQRTAWALSRWGRLEMENR